MNRNVYVLIDGTDVSVYPNITQLARSTPRTNYFKIYRTLRANNRAELAGYTIVRATLHWKTHRRIPNTGQ